MVKRDAVIIERKREVQRLTKEINDIFSGYYLNYDYLFITGERNNKWNPRRIEYNNLNFLINRLHLEIVKYYYPDNEKEFETALKSLLKSFFLYLESQLPLGDHTFISIVKLTSVLTKDKYDNNYWKLLETDLINNDDTPLYKEEILSLYEKAMTYNFDMVKLSTALYKGVGDYCVNCGCAFYANEEYYLFLDEVCSMVEKLKDKQYL